MKLIQKPKVPLKINDLIKHQIKIKNPNDVFE